LIYGNFPATVYGIISLFPIKSQPSPGPLGARRSRDKKELAAARKPEDQRAKYLAAKNTLKEAVHETRTDWWFSKRLLVVFISHENSD